MRLLNVINHLEMQVVSKTFRNIIKFLNNWINKLLLFQGERRDVLNWSSYQANIQNIRTSRAKENLTKMVVAMNLTFLAAHLSPIISFFSSYIFGYSSFITIAITAAANTLLFFTHSLSLAIYLSFDKIFLKTFSRTLN